MNNDDLSAALLCESLAKDGDARTLLFVGEGARVSDYRHIGGNPEIRIITNRYDVAREFSSEFREVVFDDFDLSAFDAEYERIGFRVIKCKPLVHHLINSSYRILFPGGRLYMAGGRREGIKTYLRKAARLFGELVVETTTRSGDRCGVVRAVSGEGEFLPDDDYPLLRRVCVAGKIEFLSKPGIFGWDKVDPGSEMLVSCLGDVAGARVLDLGCGYGFLSMRAWELGASEIVATDNNAAAIYACSANFKKMGIRGRVIPSDAGDVLDERFDIVLCNPPFHEGFGRSSSLQRKFMAACSRLTEPTGVCYLVYNSFLPYSRLGGEFFAKIETLKRDRRFTVIGMRFPISLK